MLDFLVGTIKNINKDNISLDVNGVGFKIYTNKCNQLQLEGNYTFYVSDFIKDEEIIIYGFLAYEELKMFQKLISVNGVGSKTAFSLLNNLTVPELIYFIKNKNIEALSSISGVGNRADHIVFELSNKIEDFENTNIFEYMNIFKALKKIGYKTKEINDAINKIPPGLSDQDALAQTLKEIKKNVY